MTSFSSQSLDTLVLPPSGSLILQVPCDQQSQLLHLKRVVHLTLSISAENERGTSGLCMYQGSGGPGPPDATTRQQKNEFRTVSSWAGTSLHFVTELIARALGICVVWALLPSASSRPSS